MIPPATPPTVAPMIAQSAVFPAALPTPAPTAPPAPAPINTPFWDLLKLLQAGATMPRDAAMNSTFVILFIVKLIN